MVYLFYINVIKIRLTCANAFGTKDVYRITPDEDCNSNKLGGPFRNSVFSVKINIPLPLSRYLKLKDAVTGYIACIVDDAARDMGATPGQYGYTVDTGRKYCEAKGFTYFALQNGGWYYTF